MNLDWLNQEHLIDIIETASQLILQVYLSSDFAIEEKNDNSPLTIADKKANDYIIKRLLELYPSVPIISEESKNDDYSIRQNYNYAWLIDPLDGTKEFIKKNGEFTVNIGLVFNGKPVAGFVNIPVKGLTYWAIKGKGAFIRDISTSKIEDILEKRKSFFTRGNGVMRVVASRSHLNTDTEEYLKQFKDIEMINVGSSIKILWVAENNADIYPRLNGSSEWDTCAAHAILLEVGGNLVSWDKIKGEGTELSYNKESLLNPFFICYGPLSSLRIK